MSFKINGELELPLMAAIQRFAFLAKTGAGKTYCAAVLAEEMLKNGVPIIVIDPMGVWWGLRKGADGKGDGYPVVIFGGEHGDLPLDESKAEELARALVASNISAVIDVADLSHAALQRFIPPFLDELRRINREDRHIFIEEADVIAPQKPQKDETRCLGAVDVFVRRGGNKNLGVTLISQRSAVVNKNVLTQSDYLVVLRTTAPQDKDAVAAWAVAKSADKKELNAWLDSLASLKNGEAYVWGEFGGDVQKVKVQFRQRETFHATRENLKKFEGVEPMPVDLFVERFKGVFEGKKKRRQQPDKVEEEEEQPSSSRPSRKVVESHVTQGDPAPPFLVSGHETKTLLPPHPTLNEEFIARPITTTSTTFPVTGPVAQPGPGRAISPQVRDAGSNPDWSTTPKSETVDKFYLVVTRLDSTSFIGKVLYILKKFGKRAQRKEILREAREYGWGSIDSNFNRDIEPYLGNLVLRDVAGNYSLPREVKVIEEVATPA